MGSISRVLAVAGILLWTGAADASAAERVMANGDHLHAAPGLDALAERTARAWPRLLAEATAALGGGSAGAGGRVDVVADHGAMEELLARRIPPWAGAVHLAGRVVVRADRADAGAPLRTFESTLRHEAVHLVWWQRAGLRASHLPRWFEEGLAEEIGGGVSVESQGELEVAAGFGHLLYLDEWTDKWPTDDWQAALAYAQARDFVRWFVRERGWETVHLILRDVESGRLPKRASEIPMTPFQSSIFERTGRPLDLLLQDWRLDLESRARPWYHLFGRDVFATLMLLLSFVALVAFFWVRRARRRAFAALPDD